MVNKTLLVFCCIVGLVTATRYSALGRTTTKSPFSDGHQALGLPGIPLPCHCGPNTLCRSSVERPPTKICSCITGYVGIPPSCRPGRKLWNLCFKNNHCLYSECKVVNNSASCPSCVDPYQGNPPNCQPPNHCGTEKCGPNSECNPNYVNNSSLDFIQPCTCIRGFIGDPPNCTAGPTLLALCDPYPCGGYSNCSIQDGRPKCSCMKGYEGEPPNCRPKPEMWRVCHKGEPCGYHSKCEMINRVAVCSPCDEGFQGSPPRCYKN